MTNDKGRTDETDGGGLLKPSRRHDGELLPLGRRLVVAVYQVFVETRGFEPGTVTTGITVPANHEVLVADRCGAHSTTCNSRCDSRGLMHRRPTCRSGGGVTDAGRRALGLLARRGLGSGDAARDLVRERGTHLWMRRATAASEMPTSARLRRSSSTLSADHNATERPRPVRRSRVSRRCAGYSTGVRAIPLVSANNWCAPRSSPLPLFVQ
jgi:hypothetical protein